MSRNRFSVRILIVLLAAAFMAAAAYGGTRVLAARETNASSQAQPQSTVASAAVTADGYVMPVRHAGLSGLVPGRVAVINAAEGQQVQAGDALVTLDDNIQRQALGQAQASLDAVQARLAQIKAGPRPEEVAQAEAGAATAQARLDRLTTGPTKEQVASARQAVAVAQANLERAKAGPTPEQLNAAAATLAQAEAALRQAQAAYDKVASRSDIAALPESLRLEQATNDYKRTQSSYENLKNGATPAEIKVYEQQVAQAQAALDEVLAGANPADVSAANAELARAQAGLALLKAGASRDEVAAAEAEVSRAQAGVEQARAALEQTVIRAPFAGLVGAVDVIAGEYVTPGQAIVRLGDTTSWVVETEDVTETQVVRLAPGDGVEVAVDALPGELFSGKITHIQPAGQIKRGEVRYKVTIALDSPADLQASSTPLRWGLTAGITVR